MKLKGLTSRPNVYIECDNCESEEVCKKHFLPSECSLSDFFVVYSKTSPTFTCVVHYPSCPPYPEPEWEYNDHISNQWEILDTGDSQKFRVGIHDDRKDFPFIQFIDIQTEQR